MLAFHRWEKRNALIRQNTGGMAWKKCRAMNGPMWWRVCRNGNPLVCGHTSATLVKRSTLELRSGIKPEQQIQRESQNLSPARADSPGINPKFISPCKVSLRALMNFVRGYPTTPINPKQCPARQCFGTPPGMSRNHSTNCNNIPSISTYIIPPKNSNATKQNKINVVAGGSRRNKNSI